MLIPTIFAALLATALSAPTPAPTLEVRQSATTRNELLDGPCRNVTVIFARGTTEDGNIGALVGPSLESALDSRLGANIVAFQGVDYPADIAGYLAGGSAAGGTTLAGLVNTASTKCPSTQIVLSGYRFVFFPFLLDTCTRLTYTLSQGAQVVYKGAAQLSGPLAAKIKAAVLFGNPNNGDAVPNIDNANVKTYCHAGDLICEGQPIVLTPHLTYATDTPAAADFIASRVTL